MAFRTTEIDVQDSLQGNYRPGANLIPFIRRANLFVARVNTCATAKGYTLSAAELKEIETLMACHYYQSADPGYASRNTEGAGGSFEGQTGKGLERTRYGQDAMSLDPSGCVRAVATGAVASGTWLGRRPSEQTDYVDRD